MLAIDLLCIGRAIGETMVVLMLAVIGLLIAGGVWFMLGGVA